MEQIKNNIFITLINNDSEIINALVLALSIKKLNILIKLYVIINKKLNKKLKEILYLYYDKIIFNENITSENINTIKHNKYIKQYIKQFNKIRLVSYACAQSFPGEGMK